jgi:glycerophosphoryl diester phosphodiesterase
MPKGNLHNGLAYIISFIIVLYFLFSCKKDPQLFEIKNLNGNRISLFGHAGMGIGFKYPINSFESIEPCLRIGADGTEMDIQLSKDSTVMIYHHQDLIDGTLCEGKINNKTYNEIVSCNLASPFSNSIKILSFDDLIIKLINEGYDIHNYTYTFDCKLYNDQIDELVFKKAFVRAIKDIGEKYKLTNNIIIESSDTVFLRFINEIQPNFKRYIYPNSFETGVNIATILHLDGITIHNDYITSEQVNLAHSKGISITLWGINTEEDNLKAIYKNPDNIQSDKIIHLLKVFDKYKN